MIMETAYAISDLCTGNWNAMNQLDEMLTQHRTGLPEATSVNRLNEKF